MRRVLALLLALSIGYSSVEVLWSGDEPPPSVQLAIEAGKTDDADEPDCACLCSCSCQALRVVLDHDPPVHIAARPPAFAAARPVPVLIETPRLRPPHHPPRLFV